MTAKPRNIPSLDGLRALSIGLVLISHLGRALGGKLPAISPWVYFYWGNSGVAVFFVISGFLITHLLLKELNTTGTIALKDFYFRRAFRIFPPFYVFLAVAFLVTGLGYFHGGVRSFAVAATYTWNYLGGGNDLLEHTWSLSLEEQFYLLWPAILAFFGARKGTKVALWLIVLSPFSRVLTYWLMPSVRGSIVAMLHTRIDTIMFGCLMALLWRNERFNRFIQPLLRGWVAFAGALFLLVVDPLLNLRFHGGYELPFGLTLNAIFISILLLYAVRMPSSAFGRILNTAVLRHIGVISYSLYLWQQMFTRQNSVSYFPWNLLAILACAEISYWCVERPSFRLRDRLERVLGWRRAAADSLPLGAPQNPSPAHDSFLG